MNNIDESHGKPASSATKEILEAAERKMPIGDFDDGSFFFDHSLEKFIAPLPGEGVRSDSGSRASSGRRERPERLHPYIFGLSRNRPRVRSSGKGLFQLAEGVYQIRGDLGAVTIVRGNSGWIILDVSSTVEFTTMAWGFAKQHLPGGAAIPISAIVYSHSHGDHYGGVKGFISEADVESGNVEIIAPYGFMNEVVSESILAGTAMGRRGEYHFGRLLDSKPDASERVFVPIRPGTQTLIAPTIELPYGPGKITAREVDGTTIYFKDISGTEAPASTLLYLPKYKMLFNSELMIRGLHNIYTLRGAKVRDALHWSKLINEIIVQWGPDIEMMTGPHGPIFSGNEKILEYMRVQRDNYGFIHNQTLRLVNQGVKMQDIGQAVEEIVPESLSKLWHTHGYHGTYSHNARAVVNYYIGFYDGNPANLNPLQITPEAIKFVEYMGGAASVIKRARVDFEKGNYRFVATVLNKVVTAEPENLEARHLLADTFEQLGYQSEGPQWRNAYLSASKELRLGKVLKTADPPDGSRADLIKATKIEHILDAMAIRINGSAAEGKNLKMNVVVPDVEEIHFVELSHCNLSSIRVTSCMEADTTITVSKSDFPVVVSGIKTVDQLVEEGLIKIEGDPTTLEILFGLLESGNSHFEMVPLPKSF